MSIESARDFKERLVIDEDFRNRVRAIEDKKARMDFARAEGFDFSGEEIKAVEDELTDDELHGVSGGGGFCLDVDVCVDCWVWLE